MGRQCPRLGWVRRKRPVTRAPWEPPTRRGRASTRGQPNRRAHPKKRWHPLHLLLVHSNAVAFHHCDSNTKADTVCTALVSHFWERLQGQEQASLPDADHEDSAGSAASPRVGTGAQRWRWWVWGHRGWGGGPAAWLQRCVQGSALPGAQQDRVGQGLRARTAGSPKQPFQGLLTKCEGPALQDQDNCWHGKLPNRPPPRCCSRGCGSQEGRHPSAGTPAEQAAQRGSHVTPTSESF